MAIKPEDILPDETDSLVIDGVKVRKGSIAAAMANAKVLADANTSEAEKMAARDMLKQLMPGLLALGLHEAFDWKNPEIQRMMQDALKAK